MKLTAEHLKKMNIVERVFPEPVPYTRETMEPVILSVKREIESFLGKYQSMTGEQLTEHRYMRFRKM